MNIEQARFNMVEQQIRPWDVLDTRVLDLLFEVRREDFVPESLKNLAFADLELPLSSKITLLSPKMEARLVQELRVASNDRILQVGVANGYIAALLSKLGQSVLAVEIDPVTAQNAQKLLASQQFSVDIVTGDAALDWPEGGPWDAILVTGSLPKEPTALINRLAEGGRLVAIIGDAPVMQAVRFTREPSGVRRESLFETVVPPLKNAPQPTRFSF